MSEWSTGGNYGGGGVEIKVGVLRKLLESIPDDAVLRALTWHGDGAPSPWHGGLAVFDRDGGRLADLNLGTEKIVGPRPA